MIRSAASKQSTTAQNNSSSKANAPIIVNPGPSSVSDTSMPKRSAPTSEPPPPDPSSFTFNSLLESIGPDADDSITAIAEICGKSKMSLADEHGSHMPPLGEGVVHIQRDEGGRMVAESTRVSRGQSRGVQSEELGLVGRVVEWLRGGRAKRENVRELREEEQGRMNG